MYFDIHMGHMSDRSSSIPLWQPPELGNRFRFRFVFVLCVRASGRGEAAWAREGSASSTLGLRVENELAAPGHLSSKSCCYTCGR